MGNKLKEMKSKGKIQLVLSTLFLAIGLMIVCSYAEMGTNNVVLSEACCYNDSVLHDTAGFYHDFIEIYNPTAIDRDISGFYLSDDKDNLTKYTFPKSTIIAGNEYLLLWAGEWTTAVLLEDDSYYTGFAIKPGETLYLSDSEGEIIDKVKIPKEIEKNISYSRISTSKNIWKLTQASPGEENYTDMPEKKNYLQAEVAFSLEPGFYEEPFFLEMSADEAYDIYYTLDGSTPSVDSLKYEGAILIEDVSDNENKYSVIEDITLLEDVYIPSYNVEKATVIRAIAVDENGKESKESCATYFVGYQNKEGFENITTISLVTDPDNLFGYEKGIYVTGKLWDENKEKAFELLPYWEYTAPANYLSKGRGWRREATLQYFDTSGNLTYVQQVNLGSHGGRSLSNNQKSFNIYALPEVDGKEYVLDGVLGKSQKSLMLRNSGYIDCYSTKIRDVINQEFIADRELATSKYEPCQVFIDGEYWGLYMLQERISESMIASKFSVDEDNVIILKGSNVISGEEEELELWTGVLEFAKGNDLFFDENYEQIEQMIDIQSCIEQYCFQIYVANCDSLTNNYSLWRVRETGNGKYEDGKWRWIIYDADDSTAVREDPTRADTDSFIEGNWGHNVLQDEFFLALIRNEDFRRRFVTTFMDMANYNFDSEKVVARIDELAEKLCDATVVSQKRFLTEDYNAADYRAEINVLKNFFKERYDYITAYMKTDFSLEGVLVPITVENGYGGKVKLNTLTINEGEEFQGNYYSDYWIELSADVNEGYEFIGWDVDGEIYTEENLLLDLYDEYTVVPIWKKVDD